MATAALVPMPRAVFYDPNGAPLAGGYVYTYVPGGTTTASTWQDAGEVTLNANPIVLDANGSALIYGSGDYQITVTDSLGNQVPAYSGLSQVSAISTALGPVLAAPTIAAAANLLLANGLSINLALTGGLAISGAEFTGVSVFGPSLLWENVTGTATSATLPEVGGNFYVTSNIGLGNSATAVKVGVAGTAIGGTQSANLVGGAFLAQGQGGTYALTGVSSILTNNGVTVGVPGQTGSSYGYSATSNGTFPGTVGYIATGGTNSWEYGFYCNSAIASGFYEDSNASTGMTISGNHATGIDLTQGVYTNTIAFRNGIPMSQADNAGIFRNLIYISGANQLLVGDPNLAYIAMQQSVLPVADNVYTLGNGSARWTAVWAVNGTIQTSDPRFKTDIHHLPDALPIVARLNPVTFRWREDGTRTHWGFLAPDVKAAFAPTGLDFGGYVKAENGTEHLRPDQLISVLWKACQELSARVTALEAIQRSP